MRIDLKSKIDVYCCCDVMWQLTQQNSMHFVSMPAVVRRVLFKIKWGNKTLCVCILWDFLTGLPVRVPHPVERCAVIGQFANDEYDDIKHQQLRELFMVTELDLQTPAASFCQSLITSSQSRWMCGFFLPVNLNRQIERDRVILTWL